VGILLFLTVLLAHGMCCAGSSFDADAGESEGDIIVLFEKLASVQDLQADRPIGALVSYQENITDGGSVVSEGVELHRIPNLVRSLGATGEGIRVGVISDGVDNLQDAVDAGDLPQGVRVLKNRAA